MIYSKFRKEVKALKEDERVEKRTPVIAEVWCTKCGHWVNGKVKETVYLRTLDEIVIECWNEEGE
jgi:hypothetical protein